MRQRTYTAFLSAILIAFTLLLSCSGPSEPQLAGGSGAGNPGMVAFRVVANDGHAESDTAGLGKAVAGPTPQRRALSIRDDDSLAFTVQEAYLMVYGVSLVGLNGADTVIKTGCDYQLNLLDGTAEPKLDSILVPKGEYSSIALDVRPSSGKGWSVQLGGTFVYNDSSRPFLMQFPFYHVLTANAEGGGIAPGDGAAKELTVELDAARWLRDVELGKCIRTGAVELEPDGSLRLVGPLQPSGPPSVGGPCRSIEAIIRRNIVSSGRLYGGPPKWLGNIGVGPTDVVVNQQLKALRWAAEP